MTNLNITFKGEGGRDEFKRERVADRVIRLLTSDIDISPMLIDGDWGTGKTEFCLKLANKFKSDYENYKVLYIDAFQADHADSPLMTILAEVASVLPKSGRDGFFEKALPVARFSVKTALKAGFGHILRENMDELAEGMDKYIQEAADSAIDASVMAVLKDHEKAKENLLALQSLLSELATESPMVIFIDELDRCRPDFAVQMLEVIKHTFNVDGVQFLLVTNTKQLKAAINHAYGSNVDAQRYLNKFIKFNFQLPKDVYGEHRRHRYGVGALPASLKHFVNISKSSNALQATSLPDHQSTVFGFIEDLIIRNSLSLREIETFLRNIEIYQVLSDGLNSNVLDGYQLLRVFGVYLYVFSPDFSESVVKGVTDAEKVASDLGFKSITDSDGRVEMDGHIDFLALFLIENCNENSQVYIQNRESVKSQIDGCARSYFLHYGYRSDDRFESIIEVFKVLEMNG